MSPATLHTIVPKQRKGRQSKVKLTTTCASPDEAGRLYQSLKISLIDVNSWTEFKPSIRFQAKLMNRSGQVLGRLAQSGDLIKILLPRWQSPGKLFDWREIRTIEERLCDHIEIFFITIVPAMNPELDVPEASHFLRPESTVTFFVIRDGHKLQLEVYTRNEGMNFRLSGFRTKLQSAMMGVFIAGGFYEAQWSKLMKSILKYCLSQIKIADPLPLNSVAIF
jgi:hypothetical protein